MSRTQTQEQEHPPFDAIDELNEASRAAQRDAWGRAIRACLEAEPEADVNRMLTITRHWVLCFAPEALPLTRAQRSEFEELVCCRYGSAEMATR